MPLLPCHVCVGDLGLQHCSGYRNGCADGKLRLPLTYIFTYLGAAPNGHSASIDVEKCQLWQDDPSKLRRAVHQGINRAMVEHALSLLTPFKRRKAVLKLKWHKRGHK